MINQYIIEKLLEKISTKRKLSSEYLSRLKKQASKKFGIANPTNIELLKTYRQMKTEKIIKENEEIENILITKNIRTLSGVAVVAVLTKSYPCPGLCKFCPNEEAMPKSYLSNEPAVMRAILTDFHPYKQVTARLKSLETTGHKIDKIELIVMGGTFSYLPKNYQTWFIKECFRACNEFKNKKEFKNLPLENLQKINEKAKCRIVGLTLETRPDYIDEKEIIRMRKLGATRVELGVQSLYDDILKLNKRGHLVKATIEATKLLKEAGVKINYHMMPDLPGTDYTKDLRMFKELFSNSDFQPDMLKIYPCVVVKNAPIYKWLKSGKYKPYSEKKLLELLSEIKKNIPYYVRIARLIRDIPTTSIIAGNKISNLRQVLKKKSEDENWQCKCIRCREAKTNKVAANEKIKLFRQDYEASNGKEIFLSFEDSNRQHLYSLLRLRINHNKQKHFIPVLDNSAIIREIHTYGKLAPLKTENEKQTQHTGLGKKLIKEAEKITLQEFGLGKIAVISGVGVRGYYRKLDYKLKDNYMIKRLKI